MMRARAEVATAAGAMRDRNNNQPALPRHLPGLSGARGADRRGWPARDAGHALGPALPSLGDPEGGQGAGGKTPRPRARSTTGRNCCGWSRTPASPNVRKTRNRALAAMDGPEKPLPGADDVFQRARPGGAGRASSNGSRLDESRPLAFFAGVWTPHACVRKVKSGWEEIDAYGFMTTDARQPVLGLP